MATSVNSQTITTTIVVGQGPAGAPPTYDITSIERDVSGRVTGYVRNGVAHVVSYPDSTHIVDVGGGVTVTVTLDGNGDIISSITT